MEAMTNTRPRLLSLADITSCPKLFEPFRSIAEVIEVPAVQEELYNHIAEADAYFASLYVRLDREAIERATRLRVVATPSTGLDHLDLAAMKERGIELISLKEDIEFLDNITATAEMAWALLLAVVRRLPWSFQAAQQGRWARDDFRGHQLSGMTLGILGYGRLGRIIAEYGKAFRMRVLACDTRAVNPAQGVEIVDHETLWRESDVLTLHIHLTPENTNFIDSNVLAQMKSNAIILNTSRGAIIDEAALLQVLESGRIGGAGLDVITGEWSPDLANHPLIRYAREHQNLVISPHTGGITCESQSQAYQRIAGKLKNFMENNLQ